MSGVRFTWRRLVAVSVATTLLAAAGCSSSDDKKDGGSSGAVDKVNYLTAFGAFGREGYVWVAMEKGFFSKRKIEVTVQPGEGASKNLQLLASGAAQFSANDLSGVMLLQGDSKTGYKDKVRAIASVQQQTLNAIMVLNKSGIKTPKDLEGKTIGSAPGSTPQLLFPVYAKLAGVDPTKVKFQGVAAAQTPQQLAAETVQGIGQFTVAVGTVEKAAAGAGKAGVTVLPYSDVVGDLYGNAIMTTTELTKKNPDLVKRFRDAILEGLKYSLDHPEEAGEIVKKFNPNLDAAGAGRELQLMKAYAGEASEIGTFDKDRVNRAIAIMQGTGTLQPDALKAEDIVAFDVAPVRS